MALHREGDRHRDRGQPDPEEHADKEDDGHTEEPGGRPDAEEGGDSKNHQYLKAGDRHDEEEAAQDHGRSVDRGGEQSLQESVFLIEQQVHATGQSVVQHRHHHHTRDQKADVVGGLDHLRVSRPLKEVPEEDQPKQHRLNEGEHQAELFTTEPTNPPHRQRADLLDVRRHKINFQC